MLSVLDVAFFPRDVSRSLNTAKHSIASNGNLSSGILCLFAMKNETTRITEPLAEVVAGRMRVGLGATEFTLHYFRN